MKPDTEGLRLLAEYLRNPGSGDEEVLDRNGRRWRVRARPEPGVRFIFEALDGKSVPMTMYDPSDMRPASYPPDLPFVPGVPAAVAGVPSSPEARMVVWSELPDAHAIARQIEAAGLAEGWQTTKPMTAFAGFPISMGEFRLGNLHRHLSVMSAGENSAITLMQSVRDEVS